MKTSKKRTNPYLIWASEIYSAGRFTRLMIEQQKLDNAYWSKKLK